MVNKNIAFTLKLNAWNPDSRQSGRAVGSDQRYGSYEIKALYTLIKDTTLLDFHILELKINETPFSEW
jgi:hypothetical protein